MGDFDAKTGRNYERWEGILGPRGIGKENENRENRKRLLLFCKANTVTSQTIKERQSQSQFTRKETRKYVATQEE